MFANVEHQENFNFINQWKNSFEDLTKALINKEDIATVVNYTTNINPVDDTGNPTLPDEDFSLVFDKRCFKTIGTNSFYNLKNYGLNCSMEEIKFVCQNGGTISMFKRCDGIPDCSDGSDESDCSIRCQELKNCRPNWSEWGNWSNCMPRCYNKFNERSNSYKIRSRYFLPNSTYLQDDWTGDEKESMKCSNIPKCPNDKLERIELKNHWNSESSDDLLAVKICNHGDDDCCKTELNSNYNDFTYGNLDTFYDLNYSGNIVFNAGTNLATSKGNCENFNITDPWIYITRFPYDGPSLKGFLGMKTRNWNPAEHLWLGEYIDLVSPSKRVRCPMISEQDFTYADGRWHYRPCFPAEFF